MDRRTFLTLSAAAFGAMQEVEAAPKRTENGIAWYDVRDWGVEGRGWSQTERYFDRLPAAAHGKVRDAVWNLSRHSAGMLVRFTTSAPEIHVRYDLLTSHLAMPHMPATGVSGVDLYARDEKGRDRWLAVAQPTDQHVKLRLAADIDPLPGGGSRLYTLYLPLYNGVDALEIGVPAAASFEPVAPRTEKPVLFYGTSIMHGACASRPGMGMTAIIGRRLNRPVINLGFSGNGQMEPEVGAFLAELDPAVYAIDCLPNMTAPMIEERAEPLVKQLRAARPETPILLVEDRTNTNAPFHEAQRRRHETSRRAFRAAYEHLKSAGVKHLSYLRGESLLGEDGEAATDGSHPSDLGMVRYSDAYERALKPILAGTRD
jgi:lysophospholipase L1-like esterase